VVFKFSASLINVTLKVAMRWSSLLIRNAAMCRLQARHSDNSFAQLPT
jgi:hypothetical protein